MNSLNDMIWIEYRKAIRSKMPLWTALGSLIMPLGVAFLIFVSKNPDISRKLGLVSAKADLVAFSAANWQAYLGFFGELVAAAGGFLFVLAISWIFGREFVDGTLKDMLAVPVRRANILLAKFIVVSLWDVVLTLVILLIGLAMGALLRLPDASAAVILHGVLLILVCAIGTIFVILPFALFASIGRGYLLPLGLAVLSMMLANLVAMLGWGAYFPWAIPGMYSQGVAMPAASWIIVVLTGLAGMLATSLWWNLADQSK